jgi:hypothetical protein
MDLLNGQGSIPPGRKAREIDCQFILESNMVSRYILVNWSHRKRLMF